MSSTSLRGAFGQEQSLRSIQNYFMDDYINEIHGREFDWFGRDANGSLAMFSTAGEGSVPKYVVATLDQHNRVFQDLVNHNWGSPDVWEIYGELGLFVFDWKLPGGPYIKRVSPMEVIPSDLKQQLLAIDHLPSIDANFAETVDIDFTRQPTEFVGGKQE